jgi:hypothetical protein
MSESSFPKLTRRTAFAGAGVAAAAAAAAALLPQARRDPPAADSAAKPPADTSGYQVTEHVLRYYRTTRV